MSDHIAQLLERIAKGEINVEESELLLNHSADAFLAGEYGESIPTSVIFNR
jgi:hypothetical protein